MSIRLSICIATLNRADLIGETLESILRQPFDGCEIVIVDGASTDHTEEVVLNYAKRNSNIRYIKRDVNRGYDNDLDDAVTASSGDYCWFWSSKDLMKPGSLGTVMHALQQDVSAVLVNMEIRDSALATVLLASATPLATDSEFTPDQADYLFRQTFMLASHPSCVIIGRQIWLSRERHKYYGSMHMILAVLFQHTLPGVALVLTAPLIIHRFGGQSWLRQAAQLIVMWPFVIQSLAISKKTKRLYCGSWISISLLLIEFRAYGVYSRSDYREFIRPHLRSHLRRMVALTISILPGWLLNPLWVLRYRMSHNPQRALNLHMLRLSRFHLLNLLNLRLDASRSPSV